MIDLSLLVKALSFFCWLQLPFWWIMLILIRRDKIARSKPKIGKVKNVQKAVVTIKKVMAVSIVILSGIVLIEFLLITPEKISVIKSGCLTGVLIPLESLLWCLLSEAASLLFHRHTLEVSKLEDRSPCRPL